MSRIDVIKTAAYESLKGTALEDAKVYISGTAAVLRTCGKRRTTTS